MEEETLTVDGCRVTIRYAQEKKPLALKEMKALLETQKIVPGMARKIDETEQK